MLSRSLARSVRGTPVRYFNSTAVSLQAPVPQSTKPASQSQPSLPPVPKTQLEQIRQYPAHPLLRFFRMTTFQVKDIAAGGTSAFQEESKDAITESKVMVNLPMSVQQQDFGKVFNRREWFASELRLKSSADLHTLWYVLLQERNKLATAWEELRRIGSRQHAKLFAQNLSVKNRIVQKSMGRIKFVLNERRLALIEAQWQVRQGTSTVNTAPEGSLFEDDASEKPTRKRREKPVRTSE